MALVPQMLQCWEELYKTILINPFIFFSLVLFSLLFLPKFIEGGSKLNLPPSPPRLPIIRHLHLLGTSFHRSLYALSKTYGPVFLLYFGRQPALVVTSEKIVKEIMKTQDINFSNRYQTTGAKALLYGGHDVAFALYGEEWRRMRRICVLQLLSPKRVQSFQLFREEEAAKLIQKIRCASLDGDSVNLGKMLVHTSSSIISRCIFGRMYEGEKTIRFEEISKTGFKLAIAMFFGDILPSFGWVDVLTGKKKRIKDIFKEANAFLEKAIEEHRSSKGNDDQFEEKSFIEILLQLKKEGMLDIDITQEQLKAIVADMFVGATDTTATTLEWAMTQLMKNPSEMKKVQDEVRRVVGKKSKIDQDDIDQMDYLKCVVKETLRLNPPAPLLFPRQLAEGVKLEGYDIPPKTVVLINAWAIHRDPKLWDRPEEFLPERFLNNPIGFKSQDFEFIPFGGGRRSCPGITFGVVKTEYVLANLLYWFDWSFPGGASAEDLDMREAYGFFAWKKIPLQLVPKLHTLIL